MKRNPNWRHGQTTTRGEKWGQKPFSTPICPYPQSLGAPPSVRLRVYTSREMPAQ